VIGAPLDRVRTCFASRRGVRGTPPREVWALAAGHDGDPRRLGGCGAIACRKWRQELQPHRRKTCSDAVGQPGSSGSGYRHGPRRPSAGLTSSSSLPCGPPPRPDRCGCGNAPRPSGRPQLGLRWPIRRRRPVDLGGQVPRLLPEEPALIGLDVPPALEP
jgi:hypothetical protein